MFDRFKQMRRIVTRYDKTVLSFRKCPQSHCRKALDQVFCTQPNQRGVQWFKAGFGGGGLASAIEHISDYAENGASGPCHPDAASRR